ncbi:sigma-70 family RNA polymerase sigma factor [Flaviaesturariibacter flavus]|uniref:Sigma-70 family RNA polymerase sigma factor n=2 Tax=Flaviaesturariibacter flavus TaxID=2502780 RepID=A0A4R1B3P1_9BACT|nr:sigma-70 family RNA polymerase sigma factor [Flaviaesturariibacter flavus]
MTDNDLLAQYYATRDAEWLGHLLERYTMLLFGVCMKYLKDEHEARDAVQQVFLKVLTDAGRFKIEFFKSWVYMVAKNHCLMKLRSGNGHRVQDIDNHPHAADEDRREELLANERTFHLLEGALQELTPEQRQCVTLFYLEKKSYQQIAEHTGYSGMQVKSYIQNGKRNLRILLERKLKENPQ